MYFILMILLDFILVMLQLYCQNFRRKKSFLQQNSDKVIKELFLITYSYLVFYYYYYFPEYFQY